MHENLHTRQRQVPNRRDQKTWLLPWMTFIHAHIHLLENNRTAFPESQHGRDMATCAAHSAGVTNHYLSHAHSAVANAHSAAPIGSSSSLAQPYMHINLPQGFCMVGQGLRGLSSSE